MVMFEGMTLTICIAAICKNGDEESIVFSTDHMISLRMLGQFEHSIEKYKVIHDTTTVAMLAGQPLLFDSLITIDDSSDYNKIRSKIAKNFKAKRESLIQNQIFDTFGIDQKIFTGFLNNPQPSNAINTIIDEVSNFSLATAILLVGFENRSAKISEISEGGCLDYRDINFHAIGSGTIQAINTLLFQKQSKTDDLKTTIYNVYKAKRNAEVAEGVGKETDLAILTEDGVNKFEPHQINILSNIYDKELQLGKTHQDLNSLGL